MMPLRVLCCCALAAWSWQDALGQSVVHLRGGGQQRVQIIGADAGGLRISVAANERTLPWHRVRAIEGQGEEQAKPYLVAAEHAWRGHSRLQRGDPFAAEPELAAALDLLGSEPGPSVAAIAEGLLRCRILLGDHGGAIEPWLTLLACEKAGVWAPEQVENWVSPSTGLVRTLPPMFLTSEDRATAPAWLDRIDQAERWSAGRVGDLASLYATAARLELGGSTTIPQPATSGPGVLFVRRLVEAVHGDEAQRRLARVELASIAEEPTARPWMRAWCDAAIGLSLAQGGPHELPAAIGHLISVRIQHSGELPLLAGFCLAEAATLLDRLGRADEAQRLAGELLAVFPGHPALNHPVLDRLLRSATQRPTSERTPDQEDTRS